MARGRKRKTDKGNFTAEQMKAAINMVLNDGISLRQAGERSGIKWQTLHRYVKKQKNVGENVQIRMTPNYACRQIFSRDQEETLAQYAIQCAKMCYGKSRKDLRELAYEVAITNDLNIPLSWNTNKRAGLEWLHGFMLRHQNLSIRQPEGCSLSRATSFNSHNVKLFFNNLESIYNRSPAFADGTRVYNLDETSTTTVQKPRKIIAEKGIKQVNAATSGERGILVTTCCTVSASGNFIPPVMVFPRKKFKPHMLHGAPSGTMGLANPTGWMTVDLFVDVMKHFIHHTSSSLENPSLLIMDNHESHLSAYVLDLAKKNGVTIVTIPPHCSNKLQPLDLSVYYPFKAYYNAAIESWLLRNPGRPVTIYDIAECVGVAFEKSMTPQNITAGFKKSGIYPFDKNVFTDDDFLISKVTERENPDDQNGGKIDDQETEKKLDDQEGGPSNINISYEMSDDDDGNNTIDCEETKKSEESEKETFITPEMLKGYPQAPKLKQTNRARKRKSIIATDTPELNAIEAKAKEKERKKNLQIRKKQIKRSVKTKLFSSSSGESDNDSYEQTNGSDSDELSDDDGNFAFPELDQEAAVGDFVLVEFNELKSIIYYVGKIIKQDENDYEIMFLRKSLKSVNSFVFPLQEDVSLVPKKDIKMILSQYLVLGKTKRQQSLIRFEINLSSLNIR